MFVGALMLSLSAEHTGVWIRPYVLLTHQEAPVQYYFNNLESLTK